MGIKDNFSQAVKELWKKDGKDGGKDKDDVQNTQPSASELDRYLRDQNNAQGNVLSEDDFNEGNIPLETPYYRSASSNTAKSGIDADGQQADQAKPTQPMSQTAQAEPENTAQPTDRAAQAQPTNSMRGGAQEQGGQDFRGGEQSAYNQNARRAQGQEMQGGSDSFGRGYDQGGYNNQGYNGGFGSQGGYGNYGGQSYGGSYGGGLGGPTGMQGGFGGNPPAGGPIPERNETDEITVISKNTMIDGNIRSLANMQIDGNIKGNVETTKNIDMSGKVIGDVTCNNAGMISAAMQGNISLKGRMRMDRDTILIGDLSSQYADINGRIRGKLDIVGKAELKRDAVVFGDINASTIAVTDGAIIQGYVNTTFLSKEDSRNVFPDAISIDSKEVKS